MLEPIRVTEWWEHKLAPMLGTGYMTAFHLRSSLLDLWPTFLAAVAGVAVAAAYVSLLNDATDREDDAAAGKYNRIAQRRRWYAPTAIGGVAAAGVAVAVVAWRDDPLVLALYAGPWVAFSLYSLPPIRLKARGAAGVLADACGAHLFPYVLIAVAVFHATGSRLDWAWVAAVGVWALAVGIRSALWHQLGDAEADSRSGVKTFGRLHPGAARVTGQTVFAIELAAFFLLGLRAGSLLPFALVLPYLLLELARVQLWGGRLIVVRPAPRSRVAMHEYYVLFYPLAFAVSSTVVHGQDILVLALQMALFSGLLMLTARDTKNALTQLIVVRHPPAVPRNRRL
jgi:4-hydroxybenzoate polyprenyltransferase